MDPAQIPLRGLHLPDAIGWWPLAPGWWVIIALLAAGLILLLRRARQRRRESAARRHALRQLERATSAFAKHGDPVRLGSEASEILRRTMLAYAPRSDVAGLTGEAWLDWLDRDLPEPRFSKGPGRSLLDLPYRNPRTVGDTVDIGGMLVAVHERLRTPVGGER
jgi:type II secretory pathway pseudopilin PulG